MTLKECYDKLGGDYESAVSRLINESLVKKFVLKFLNDLSYETLVNALEKENYEEAFHASHTIKGICQNLSFTDLYKSSRALTEALRENNTDEIQPLAQQVKADYERTIAAIKEFQQDNI
jgi:HPt (histidine-containing phosphotransfer) domain-containing protein